MNKRLIQVVDYDPQWIEGFENESRLIQATLEGLEHRLHHIGSTSVPGLKAKPIIDILLEVRQVEELDQFNHAMEELGYCPKGEFGIPGRRFYLKGLYKRSHHVHAFNFGVPDVVRHLAFRDYLIEHQGCANEYGALKSKLAMTCHHDNEEYCKGKDDFVKEIERKALDWRLSN